MLTNDEQFRQTQELLEKLEQNLASLKEKILPINPERFHLMAEAYFEHIIELREEIDEYIGIRQFVESRREYKEY